MKIQDVNVHLRGNVDPRVAKVIVSMHQDIAALELKVGELARFLILTLDACQDMMNGVKYLTHQAEAVKAAKEAVNKLGDKYDPTVHSEEVKDE